jgi:hypothetical protein
MPEINQRINYVDVDFVTSDDKTKVFAIVTFEDNKTIEITTKKKLKKIFKQVGKQIKENQTF